MAIRTQVAPKHIEDVLDEQDRSKIHNIIEELRGAYVTRLHDAVLELNHAQRQVNRASHEITRLERHLERIDAFCTKNNIPLSGQGE